MSLYLARENYERNRHKTSEILTFQPAVISSTYHESGTVTSGRPPAHPGSSSGSGNVPEIKYEIGYEQGPMGAPGSLIITIVECRVSLYE